MLNNEFKKSATEKLKSMDSNEFKKAFKAIGSELQTNEEWFCQLPTGEKAKWFCDHITCSDGCKFYGKCFNEHMGRELWEKWLKQPHTKE